MELIQLDDICQRRESTCKERRENDQVWNSRNAYIEEVGKGGLRGDRKTWKESVLEEMVEVKEGVTPENDNRAKTQGLGHQGVIEDF